MARTTPPPSHEPSSTPTRELVASFYAHLTTLDQLLPASVVRQDDTEAYKRLLRLSLVGSQKEVVLRVDEESERAGQEMSVKEVLNRAQSRIWWIHQNYPNKSKPRPQPGSSFVFNRPQNILTEGYVNVSGNQNYVHYSGVALMSKFPNTTVSHLCDSLEWYTLLTRIGHGPLHTLFSNPTTAVFTPLPNACFLQVSGQRLADVKQRYPLSRPPSVEEEKKKGRKRCERPRKRGRKKSRGGVEENVGDEEVVETEEGMEDVRAGAVEELEEARLPFKRRKLVHSTSAPLLEGGRPSSPITSPVKSRSMLRPTQSVGLLGMRGVKRGRKEDDTKGRPRKVKKEAVLFSPNEVTISRNRIFHARASRSDTGKIVFGFSRQHIFTRLPLLFPSPITTTGQCHHLAKYVFPRQFGLYNPFTSPKPVKGFAVNMIDRSEEIREKSKGGRLEIPKRLEGVVGLLAGMLRLEKRCKYRALLERFCPSKLAKRRADDSAAADASIISETTSNPRTQVSHSDLSIEISHPSLIVPHGAADAQEKVKAKPRFADFAMNHRQVTAYVQAVVQSVIPRDFWGSPANERLILQHIKTFVRFRRYETFSIHALLQGFSIADCDWLRPKSGKEERNREQKANEVEMERRKGLLADFMLWFFEGFVVELLRTAFNATETSDLRNRTVYFRQDDWVALCKPQWAKLIQSTFERLDKATAETILASRKLGYSFVRLLPKETGVRPIMNLQMKPKKKVGNELKIGKSINRVLRGTFHALTYEKNQPRKTPLLGAAVTGPGDIYTRMKGFKLRLLEGRKSLPELFFVKVDVRACYDTIKQEKLLAIVQKILDNGDETYRIESHEVVSRVGVQTRRQWPSKASAENTRFSFPERAAELAEDNRYAVFSDKIFYFTEEARDMQQYLREHVTNNLVKIGSRFYRQKDGIPQGSILSGLLCNLFYGNMEQANLAFTNDSRSLLLRYIDDFMFITADKSLALRFLEVMSKGIPEYGCFVSPEKGLTNFDASIDGVNMMPKLSGKDFPFCGMLVNTVSLEVKAETARYEDIEMADKLSVERHKRPGTAFLMKMLKECKRRTHPIYTDTSSFNKISTAYLNVYQSFLFVALKFRSYVHEWGADPRERVPFFRRVINQLVHFMYSVIKGQIQSKNGRKMGAACNMKPSTVSWLGYHAFHRLLLAKPMIYRPILKYLSKELRQGSRRHGRKLARHLDKVVKERTNAFAEGVAWRRKTL